VTPRRLLALAVVGLAAAGVIVIVLQRLASVDPPGPSLLVHPEPEPAREYDEPSAEAKARVMSLVVASLSPEERARTVEIMSYAAARLEARASSLVVDLGDDIDPMAELQMALGPYLPSITAARTLDRGVFKGAGFVATPAASCPPKLLPSGDTCLPTWRPPAPIAEDHAFAERVRFAAWPIAYATIADLGTRAMRDTVARSLRGATSTSTALHALVLTVNDLELTTLPEQPALVAAARRLGRAMEANDLHESSQLDGLARAAPPGRVAPWLTLSPSELLVVPRLSTVARAGELRERIRQAAGGASVRLHGL